MKETWFCYILELFVLHTGTFYQFDTSFKRPLSNDQRLPIHSNIV